MRTTLPPCRSDRPAAATADLVAPRPPRRPVHPVRAPRSPLLGNLDYRVTPTGQAPRGARVYLQDRFDEHQLWATQKSGHASGSGSFRLATTTDRAGGHYRVCVSRPGKDRVQRRPDGADRQARRHDRAVRHRFPDRRLRDHRRHGGAASRFLRDLPLSCSTSDPTSGKWQGTGDLASVTVDGKLFDINLDSRFPGLVSKQGLRLRVVAQGNAWVRSATKGWTVDSYTQRPVAAFPVKTGSETQGNVVYGFLLNAPATSAAMSPTNTIALTVPEGCGRIQAGISQDRSHSDLGPFSALVERNGVTAWSYDSTAPGPHTFSLDVAGGDTVSLTVSFDPTHPEWRPWFVTPFAPVLPVPKLPFALCAAP